MILDISLVPSVRHSQQMRQIDVPICTHRIERQRFQVALLCFLGSACCKQEQLCPGLQPIKCIMHGDLKKRHKVSSLISLWWGVQTSKRHEVSSWLYSTRRHKQSTNPNQRNNSQINSFRRDTFMKNLAYILDLAILTTIEQEIIINPES